MYLCKWKRPPHELDSMRSTWLLGWQLQSVMTTISLALLRARWASVALQTLRVYNPKHPQRMTERSISTLTKELCGESFLFLSLSHKVLTVSSLTAPLPVQFNATVTVLTQQTSMRTRQRQQTNRPKDASSSASWHSLVALERKRAVKSSPRRTRQRWRICSAVER